MTHQFKLFSTIQNTEDKICPSPLSAKHDPPCHCTLLSTRFSASLLLHLDQIVDSDLHADPAAVAGAGVDAVGAVDVDSGVGVGAEVGADAGVIVAEALQTVPSTD